MSLTALVYISLFGISSLAALLYSPAYGIYFYILNAFLYSPNKWWFNDIPDIKYVFLNSLVILIAFVIHNQHYKNISVFHFKPTKWFLTLIALSFVVLLYAHVPVQHQYYTIQLAKIFVLYFIMVKTINTHQKLDILLLVFIVGCFHMGWEAYSDPSRVSGRLEGVGGVFFSTANEAARVTVLSIPLMVYFLLKGSNKYKIITIICLPFIMNVFILFNSRGAFVGLAIAGLYLLTQLLTKSKYFNVNKAYIILACFFLVAAFIHLTDQTFIDRISTINTSSDHGRLHIWKGAWNFALDYPFGLGRRGFDFLSSQYVPQHLLVQSTGTRAVHNTYLEALTSLGFLGLFLLIMFIVTTFKNAYTSKKEYIDNAQPDYVLRTIVLESSYIGFLVASFFGNNFFGEFLYIPVAFIVINRSLSSIQPESCK